MKALTFHGRRDVRVDDVPDPAIHEPTDAIGQSGDAVTRAGDHLAADLLISDAAGAERALGGVELSNGYFADFDFTPVERVNLYAFYGLEHNKNWQRGRQSGSTISLNPIDDWFSIPSWRRARTPGRPFSRPSTAWA